MKSVTFVLLAASSLLMAAQGASFKSEIALLPGEVWWGGGGGDGQNQPYGLKDSRRINLRRSGATTSERNTSAPRRSNSRTSRSTASRAMSALNFAAKMAAFCGDETNSHGCARFMSKIQQLKRRRK